MIKRPTYKSIQIAAKKSKRAALKLSIDKYLYLMTLTPKQIKKLPKNYLYQEGCAICIRYLYTNYPCPLKGCLCTDSCIREWVDLTNAQESIRDSEQVSCNIPWSHGDYDLLKFRAAVSQIYVKLMKAAG